MKDDLKYRDVLVVGADHYNTLWLNRALGMAGFIPTCIIYGVTKSFVGKSRWCKRRIIRAESTADVFMLDDKSTHIDENNITDDQL